MAVAVLLLLITAAAGQVPTISYTECSFPFTYGGVVRYSCIKNMTGITDINNQYGCNAVSTPNQVNATGAICTGQPEGYQCPVGPSTLSVGSNSYQTTDVCGWSVVMLRYNTTTFNWTQNWNAYKNGFGSPDGSDFWLGLEPLYQLTSTGNYRLRIEVSKRDLGILAWYSGEYYQFNIGDELTSQYAISVSGWTGDGVALDSFNPPKSLANATQNGQKFSTFDVDNDNYPGPYFNGSCSQWYGGVGWWFSNSSSYCFYQLLTNMNLGANYWGYNYKGLSYYRASTYGVRWMIKPR